MSFRSKLEEAVNTYQPRVEELMNVNLGEIAVKNTRPIKAYIEYYNKIQTFAIDNKIENSTKGKIALCAIYHVLETVLQSAYIRGDNEDNTIYAGIFRGRSKEINKCIDFIACHELAHLAHKEIVGSNTLCIWPKEDTENIANYVAAKILSKEQKDNLPDRAKKLVKNHIQRILTSEINMYYNKSIIEYISKRGEEIRQRGNNKRLLIKVINKTIDNIKS